MLKINTNSDSYPLFSQPNLRSTIRLQKRLDSEQFKPRTAKRNLSALNRIKVSFTYQYLKFELTKTDTLSQWQLF